ncbi:hypothetical protein GCM10022198_24560 [Klugiella xanthotipulae]|uniref:Putative membrane protein n=1 Tax=Klugiella xanthotipulae TaxID=244735 RepID=A0A543I663_9MICO|nr:DoxX family membrane protein [Klugiella xanthotipulae]TQM66096.1 putative membrane protein [Klugiella xanthotipulae]
MAPLVILVAVFLGALLVTSLRGTNSRSKILLSLRASIAATFFVTGTSHFIGMTAEMIEMVPNWLPAPDLIVFTTGILEILAAMAMFSRRVAPWAGLGLTALLIAMFPANINLALTEADLPWSQTLAPRTAIQVIFLAATSCLAIVGFKRASASSTRRG